VHLRKKTNCSIILKRTSLSENRVNRSILVLDFCARNYLVAYLT